MADADTKSSWAENNGRLVNRGVLTRARIRHLGGLVVALVIGGANAAAQQHDHASTVAVGRGLHFDTTCRGAIGGLIDGAVEQLHHFAFEAAAATFRQAAHSDIDCTTAAWGAAMARWGQFTATGRADLLAEGWRALDTAELLTRAPSERERRYLEAVRIRYRDRLSDGPQRYADAMAALARDFPADPHAALFAALARVDVPASSPAEALEASRAALALLAADGLPRDDLAVLHYTVLAGDEPTLAGDVLPQARALAAAPTRSSYLQRVPAITFERLGLWDEAIAAGQRAADTARAVGAGGDELRALDGIVRALLQAGRADEARAVARRLDAGYLGGVADDDAAVLRTRIAARVALETDDFAAASALPVEAGDAAAAAVALFARAVAAARLGHSGEAATSAARLEALDAPAAGDVRPLPRAAAAWAAFAAGRHDDALAALEAVADAEDAAVLRGPTRTPLLPAREQLGDLLLAMKRPREAETAYAETLRRWPGRARARAGLATARAATGAAPR